MVTLKKVAGDAAYNRKHTGYTTDNALCVLGLVWNFPYRTPPLEIGKFNFLERSPKFVPFALKKKREGQVMGAFTRTFNLSASLPDHCHS